MTTRTAVTAKDWRDEMGRLRIPRGTKSLADYEHVKGTLSAWLRNLASVGIEAPSYEACIREVADWVGV